MRGTLGVVLLLGCAPQSRVERPYRDAPLVVPVATGAAGAAAGMATAAVLTVAVGAVVVGAEQFPDPPAGTPPVETAPKDSNSCKGCRCFGRGVGPAPQSPPRVPDGNGYGEHTRASCQKLCRDDREKRYGGFDCSGDQKVTWFN